MKLGARHWPDRVNHVWRVQRHDKVAACDYRKFSLLLTLPSTKFIHAFQKSCMETIFVIVSSFALILLSMDVRPTSHRYREIEGTEYRGCSPFRRLHTNFQQYNSFLFVRKKNNIKIIINKNKTDRNADCMFAQPLFI